MRVVAAGIINRFKSLNKDMFYGNVLEKDENAKFTHT